MLNFFCGKLVPKIQSPGPIECLGMGHPLMTKADSSWKTLIEKFSTREVTHPVIVHSVMVSNMVGLSCFYIP